MRPAPLPMLLALAVACAGPAPPAAGPVPPAAEPSAEARPAARDGAGSPDARRAEFLERWARSYVPGRSGDIMLVPAEGYIVTSRGSLARFMHGSPWDYDARVPLILYGPGHVRAGHHEAPVSHDDLGATLSRLLGVPLWPGASGRPLGEALRESGSRPRVVAAVMLDAFRPDYLERFPEETPTLRRLRADGASFEAARARFLPTATAVTHSSLSTASAPAVHGIVGNRLYDPVAGEGVDAFPEGDARHLLAPTLADRLAAHSGGRSRIGILGGADYAAAALAGRGACGPGGRAHLLAFYDSGDPDGRWATIEPCHRLPGPLQERTARAEWEAEGGRWMGHPIAHPRRFSATGLYARFEGEAVRAVLEGAPFGADTVPDLLLANWKALDRVSHVLGPFSDEARSVVAEVDRQLAELVSTLERVAGPEGFVLAVTADHGMPAEPEAPARRVVWEEILSALQARFDPGGAPFAGRLGGADMQLTLDRSRLEALELEPERIAAYLEELPFLEAAFAASEVSRAAAALTERSGRRGLSR